VIGHRPPDETANTMNRLLECITLSLYSVLFLFVPDLHTLPVGENVRQRCNPRVVASWDRGPRVGHVPAHPSSPPFPNVRANLFIKIRKIIHPNRTPRTLSHPSRRSLSTRLPLNCARNRGSFSCEWERESEYRQDRWRGKWEWDGSYRRCEVGG